MPSVYPTALDVLPNKIDHIDTFFADDINTPAQGIMSLQALIGAGATVPTSNATANTIAKRNSNGDISVAYLNALLGLQAAKSTQAAPVFAVDVANLGTGFTLANTAIAYPFSLANVFGGIWMIKETTTDGHMAVLLNAGHNVIMLAESSSGTIFSTTAGHGGTVNVYTHGSLYCPAVENLRGGSRTFEVTGWRLSATS